ncbi:YfiR family protein [Photobacterium kagoshimensis]|uniref:YfiR family protein n=1 Tax=Photobacterium kagoshimensis TaxID=2910242 RepID=UPI003D149D4F
MWHFHRTLYRLLSQALKHPVHTMLFFISSLLVNGEARAEQSRAYDDYQIKAVYIYRFASFIRWPQAPNHQIQYCAYGADNISQTLHQLVLNDLSANKRLVFHYIDNLSQAEQCELVYISPSQFPISHAIPQLSGVLTISGYPDFLDYGGMIELRADKKRIRPIIALDVIKHANMAISSQLLRIAIIGKSLTSGLNDNASLDQ